MNGIAEFRSTVIDCPDPRALADFYSGSWGGPSPTTRTTGPW